MLANDPNAVPQDDPNADALDPNLEPPQPQTPPEPSEVERIAIELGWTPQDKWRGDPSKWTPAADFLRGTKTVLERTKHEAKRYRSEFQTLAQRMAQLEKGQTSIQQMRAEELNEQYEQAKFNAAKEGNQELYAKLVKEQAETLAKVRPAPQQQQTPQEVDVYAEAEAMLQDPAVVRLINENPIILESDDAWNYAQTVAKEARDRGATHVQALKAVSDALQWAFPQAYASPQTPQNGNGAGQHHAQNQRRAQNGQFVPQNQQPQRRPAPPIAGAQRTSANGAPATAVDRLPADAKAFLDAKMKSGEVKDGDRWARVYLGEKVPVVGAA